MDFWDLLLHLLNFAAPALAVGWGLALASAVLYRKVPAARMITARAAINCVAGLLALGLGLVLFGRDGKIATYAAMVLACAASQWWAMRR